MVPVGHAVTLAIVTGAAGAGGGGEGCAKPTGVLTSMSAATSTAAMPRVTPALRHGEAKARPAPQSRGAARVSRAHIPGAAASERDGGPLPGGSHCSIGRARRPRRSQVLCAVPPGASRGSRRLHEVVARMGAM